MSNETLYPYRESKQFEKFISQFMRIFSGFQTRDGVERDGEYEYYRVPVIFGKLDRVVAHMMKKGDTYINQKIPIFSVNLSGIEPDDEGKKNFHHKEVYNTKRIHPENPKTVERIMGPAFIMNFEVSLWASSMTEMFDIMEQVLLIFNPRVTITLDSSAYNCANITEVTMNDIQDEVQYPLGQDKRVVMSTMNFSVPVRLSYPRYVGEANIIEQIKYRILDETAETSYIEDIVEGEEE